MATNKLQWKRIAKGDRLPCQSFLRKKDGEILKLSTIGGVEVGQDCYYLPVDEVINVIKDYPVEESEDERIINNIRKVIGWYRNIFTEKNLMPEQYQEIDAWLDKKGERKHQYKSRPRYVGEGELLGKKESTVFSGDENIRKALIEMVHDTVGDSLWIDYNVHKEDAITWLEKQGEHKPTAEEVLIKAGLKPYKDGNQWCVLLGDNIQEGICGFGNTIEDALYAFLKDLITNQGEQKPADNVEPKYAEIVKPKFKDGDWVVYQNETFQVRSLSNGSLILQGKKYQTYFIADLCCAWTIQDAKDGDVLVASDGSIFLFKETVDNACKHYAALTTDGVINLNKGLEHYWETSRVVYPATEEQRAFLFQKIKEAGYEWDAEKKELKQIEQKPILDVEIPFGAKDSELEEDTYYIPKGYHAEIKDNKVVIKKDKKNLVKCLFSNDNYTDEERKVLCDGCKVECELKKLREE